MSPKISPEEREHTKAKLHSMVEEFAIYLEPIYAAAKWTWWGEGSPKASSIEKSIHHLIDSCHPDPRDEGQNDTTISSGGIYVYIKLNPLWSAKKALQNEFHVDDEFQEGEEPKILFGIDFRAERHGYTYDDGRSFTYKE